MKSNHGSRLLTLAGLVALASTSALAQPDPGTTYVGLGAGQANSQVDEGRMANRLLAPGVTTTSLSDDTRGKAFKVFGGYQFNRNLALQAGYFNLGKFGFSANTAPPGTLDGAFKVHGFNLDLVGTLPLTDRLSALAGIGAQYAKTKADFTASGAASPVTAPRKESGSTNVKYGAGLQYALNPSLLLRGEVERYRITDPMGDRGHINVASLSLVFPLGRTQAPRPVAAAYVAPPPAAPIIVAAAPPPPPVVVVTPPPPPPPPPAPTRVSFSAESLFGFDKSALRPEGMTALDTFSRDLAGSQYERVSVEGHTDRLGTPAYNQKLSEQRADVVKRYLVSNGRIDAGKVSAQGKGEMVPVTRPEDCKGSAASPRLIACLQPDRRVDIEVVGTR
ncbi:MAG TPA: OmpA family protein [Burkholderiaceae bacterium]|nr:OmpA family protein [Burkholderiaceae bacterium]